MIIYRIGNHLKIASWIKLCQPPDVDTIDSSELGVVCNASDRGSAWRCRAWLPGMCLRKKKRGNCNKDTSARVKWIYSPSVHLQGSLSELSGVYESGFGEWRIKRTVWENTTRGPMCWKLYRTQTFSQLVLSHWEKIKIAGNPSPVLEADSLVSIASADDISGCVSFCVTHLTTQVPPQPTISFSGIVIDLGWNLFVSGIHVLRSNPVSLAFQNGKNRVSEYAYLLHQRTRIAMKTTSYLFSSKRRSFIALFSPNLILRQVDHEQVQWWMASTSLWRSQDWELRRVFLLCELCVLFTSPSRPYSNLAMSS